MKVGMRVVEIRDASASFGDRRASEFPEGSEVKIVRLRANTVADEHVIGGDILIAALAEDCKDLKAEFVDGKEGSPTINQIMVKGTLATLTIGE